MSLRSRLALFFALSIAAALLAQGVLGYLSFKQQAYASLDRNLSVYLAQVQSNLARRSPRTAPSNVQLLNELFEGYVARARVVYQGRVVAQHEGFPDEVPLDPSPTPTSYGAWRVASRPLASDTPGEFYLQAAISSREVVAGIGRYQRTVLLTVLVVSAVGALAAFLLSQPALRPLRLLADTARRVASSGDLSLRVPAEGGGELRELSQTFNRMLERLAAFRTRERAFTRNASHELRTPLSAMKLQLSAYREGYTDAETTLDVFEQELERMTRLTEALLTLAREGRTQRLAIDVARLARDLADAAGVPYQGPEHLWSTGDPVLLRQALGNLLENARKYAPGTAVALTLGTLTEAGRTFAVLSVTDEGPGLPEEVRAKALEPFYRAPGTAAPGSGLGLAVAAQVAEAHGGRLELRANHPRGLRAELWLALEPTAGHPAATPPLSDAPADEQEKP